MNIIRKLYIFQKERFPLQILLFTTLATVLSSAAVVQKPIMSVQILVAFISTLFLLFHIRVIDESRDFETDSSLHPERPVQRGIISVKQLFLVSITGIFITLLIALFSGIPSTILTIAILIFTSLAWKDFFVKSYFLKRPVLYHIINSPQMVLIQWNIFSIFTNSFRISWLMILQLMLTYNCVFIVELARKIRIPEADTADTYSSSMGIKKTILFINVLIAASWLIVLVLLKFLGTLNLINIVAASLISLAGIAMLLVHKKVLSRYTEKLMIFSIVLYYVAINTLIYFSI